MDLLKELSKTINFTYSLALSPDGQFGSYVIKNSSGERRSKILYISFIRSNKILDLLDL